VVGAHIAAVLLVRNVRVCVGVQPAVREDAALLRDTRRVSIAGALATRLALPAAVVLHLLVLASDGVKAPLAHVLPVVRHEDSRRHPKVGALLLGVAAVASTEVHEPAILVVLALLRDVRLEGALTPVLVSAILPLIVRV